MVDQNPKRSGEPPVWLMFGAGGTVSAIFFPVVILILGLLLRQIFKNRPPIR